MYRIIICVIASLMVSSASGQKQFIGLWEGKMNVGVELRIVFRISMDSSRLTATLNVPEQGLKDVNVSSIINKNDSLIIEISQFGASYSGKLQNDSIINGQFRQQASIPLQLKKVRQITERVRFQTPVPPFPYRSENITYTNSDHSIRFGATLTTPNGKGPFPAVMLLTGSGLQNRDEEIAGHKPFAVIADHLTKNGFMVLRADDRGMGETTGDPMLATTYDFSLDAKAGIDYLRSLKQVDKKNIGLIGHSEGAMIAQLMASESADIHFIISLAGPGEKITRLMSEQNKAMLSKSGLASEFIEKYLPLYDSILQVIIHHKKEDVDSAMLQTITRWADATPEHIVLATTGIKDENSMKDFIHSFSSKANTPWFRYFLQYDPSEKIRSFKGHFLALNGDQDIQVISKSNLNAIELALKNGKAKSYEIHELKGLNHLFQECKICTTYEYVQLEQTISPIVLDLISSWLKKISNNK